MLQSRLIPTIAIVIILFIATWSLGTAEPSLQQEDWQQKVDPALLAELEQSRATNSTAEFLIVLNEQADLSGADQLRTKEAKGRYVYEQLTAVARRTQPAVIAALEEDGKTARPFWVTNMVLSDGDLSTIQNMAQRTDVSYLYANPAVALNEPDESNTVDHGRAVQSIEWNILKINADDVWAAGFTGEGAVVGGQDTGYNWDHSFIVNQYRGWDGITTTHDYNWHDAISADNSFCDGDSVEPCDDHGHGTHTMGTIVGNDLASSDANWPEGASNAVGVAPGAEWIACRNMDRGNGTPASYTECYEWFIAPYPYGGDPLTDGDPSKAPDVINNSWACTGGEGCSANTLLSVVQAVRAAGIVTVHSNGNYGSSCSTVHYPAANYDESFSVGATSSNDSIAGFSSRGPVTNDGSNRLKPDISAPGVNVRSASRTDGSTASLSGTSMAGPHVAGLVALLISADPSLAGDVDLIEHIIQETAVELTTTQGCGGDSSTAVPNNVYGYGRIDAYAALEYLQALNEPFSLDFNVSAPTQIYQVDGSSNFTSTLTYTYSITNGQQIFSQTNIVINDTIPPDTIFITATQPVTVDHSGPNTAVQWPIDMINGGETVALTLTVQVTGTTNVTTTVTNDTFTVGSDQTAETTAPTVTSYLCGSPVASENLLLSTSDSQASLSWDGYSDEYELWVSADDPNFTVSSTERCENSTSCTILKSTPHQFLTVQFTGESYYYKVRGRSGCGAVSADLTNSVGTSDYALLANGLFPLPYQNYQPIMSR